MRAHPRGFVLTEVLVVSIIVAILAVTAIPLYTGYVQNQKKMAALAIAQTASITAASILRRTGVAPTSAELNAALAIPNATQFTITVIAGPKVRVIENSEATADTSVNF